MRFSIAAGQQLGAVKWVHFRQPVPYALGLALQETIVAARLAARQTLGMQPSASPAARAAAASTEDGMGGSSAAVKEAERVARQDYLLLLEHTPVYTEGRRKGAKGAIADDEEGKRLRALGAEYVVAQRGGLITFHGPGQLVGYPIWDISRMEDLSTRCYVDKLQTTFRTLLKEQYRIGTVPPPDGHTGVWADEANKILSIGIQIRQRITSHGFALNVHAQPLLTWFSHIVACGIAGKRMTSVERELARRLQEEEQARPDREAAAQGMQTASEADGLPEIEPGLRLGPESLVRMEEVAPLVARQLGTTYGRRLEQASDKDVRYESDAKGIVRRVWFAGREVRAVSLV